MLPTCWDTSDFNLDFEDRDLVSQSQADDVHGCVQWHMATAVWQLSSVPIMQFVAWQRPLNDWRQPFVTLTQGTLDGMEVTAAAGAKASSGRGEVGARAGWPG